MAAPVDMGYRHRGNAFGDHMDSCRYCQRGGRGCPTVAAMERDFERQARARETPTVEIPGSDGDGDDE